MPLNRVEKEAVIAEVNAVAAEALSLVGAEYRGLTAEALRELRKQAHDNGVWLRVVKNNLVKLAFKGTDFECTQDALTGPLILGLSVEDPGAAARVFKDFAKDNKALEVKLVSTGGQTFDASELERLASLPTRDQALGQLAGLLQAPISKFVRTVAAPQVKLVRTLAAVRDQKEAA